ncbi:cell wall-binding repeat-containing protein [Rossellomorea vietnamensis]|uniref:cell wall-binding repeat-containing protein n=1 Tax=Rossellomorea vietnamensis TaxID=218284 RepID=UPI003CF47940
MNKKFLPALLALIVFFSGIDVLQAAEPAEGELAINQMLTEKAMLANIPPEILKAIAYQEKWIQDHQPDDEGIGLFGIHDKERFDEERLETDDAYNTDAAIELLNERWERGLNGELPRFKGANRQILEHWYFVILAYDGVSAGNYPIEMIEGKAYPNSKSYQSDIYKLMALHNDGLLTPEKPTLYSLPFKEEDFSVNGGSLIFNTMEFSLKDYSFTYSKYLFEKGDIARVKNDGWDLDLLIDSPFKSEAEKIERVSFDSEVEILEDTHYLDYVLREFAPFNQPDQSYIIPNHGTRYKVKVLDGTNRRGYLSSAALVPVVTRIDGLERYETANEIALEGWQDGADTVVIAQGNDFPDALAGAPLAAYHEAPVLLVEKGKAIREDVLQTIKALDAQKAIILGGTAAVSNQVADTLKEKGLETSRIAGGSRFETAKLIADELPETKKAVVAYGYNFPDALSIAPFAANELMPILLTDTVKKGQLPEATLEELQHKELVYIVGGTSVIPEKLVSGIHASKTRLSGGDRYKTSEAIINHFAPAAIKEANVATGRTFADALTGALLASKRHQPLILADTKNVDEAKRIISNKGIQHLYYLGGKTANNTQHLLRTKLAE